MIESGASSNVMPVLVRINLNVMWESFPTQIVQLYRSRVKLLSELKKILLTLSIDLRIHQVVDIVVANVQENYGMRLSRD